MNVSNEIDTKHNTNIQGSYKKLYYEFYEQSWIFHTVSARKLLTNSEATTKDQPIHFEPKKCKFWEDVLQGPK